MQRKRGEGGVAVSFVKLCFGWLGPGKIEAILSVQCFRDAIRCVSFSFWRRGNSVLQSTMRLQGVLFHEVTTPRAYR